MNEVAQSTVQGDGDSVKFVSICCDALDGAREILERDSTPRWSAMHHFYMAQDDKEQAKKLLGFKQVPFYVVFNDKREMVFTGGKFDLESVPGMKMKIAEDLTPPEPTITLSSSPSVKIRKEVELAASSPNNVFSIDDLDF